MIGQEEFRQMALTLGYVKEPSKTDTEILSNDNVTIAAKFSWDDRIIKLTVNGVNYYSDLKSEQAAMKLLEDNAIPTKRAKLAAETIDQLRGLPRVPGNPAQESAHRAAAALVAYADRTREDEFVTMIADLVGDLMHLCDALGIDPDDALDRGRNYYHTDESE